ncbi:MAG: DEAD/DEAH box helicase [Rhodothermales bacterium]
METTNLNSTPATDAPTLSFKDLNLPPALLRAIEEVGYETPSPIQAKAIPPLLEGKDLFGRAPTGTGKTAAFALPLLSRIDLKSQTIQLMVLTPTRELAIQVAEALQRYASGLGGLHVLPVYGGQAYGGQIRQLKRGVQAIVGTPGRIMDHMNKGTLKLDNLKALVLDEADEMLRMGFIDDVEWILDQTPAERQIALFSATMPREIVRIAKKHLRDPVEIAIQTKTATASTIRQRFWPVSGVHKLDALTRILEVEPFDAMLIFVRTKIATTQLAEKLEARGHAASALNGDMPQAQREQMIERLKKGSIDILVATDVAARGLDVERISHVVNYDIPTGTESYIHRIGRTGRAGREGEAILFVAPRERRLLSAIEKATRQPIEQLKLPTAEMVTDKRIGDFKQAITDTLGAGDLAFMRNLLENYQEEHNIPVIEIAAALAQMAMGDKDLVMKKEPRRAEEHPLDDRRGNDRPREDRGRGNSEPMTTYRIEVGYIHDVKPGNIVGAIANETGLDSKFIGQIDIQTDHTFVDMPGGMPKEVMQKLGNVWVCGQKLAISTAGPARPFARPSGKPSSKSGPRTGGKPSGKPSGKPKKDYTSTPGGMGPVKKRKRHLVAKKPKR